MVCFSAYVVRPMTLQRNKDRLWVAVLLLVCAMPRALGQQINTKSTILGTSMDIESLGGGCPVCHIPHQSPPKGRTLLWSPAYSTEVFGAYDSPNMDPKAQEIGNPSYSDWNLPLGARIYSLQCLSCHDGVTVPTEIGPTSGAAVGNPTYSEGLTNDHPVNVVYDPSITPDLNPIPAALATNVRLYEDWNGTLTVQCASCHDVHDAPKAGNYLRVPRQVLCTVCHRRQPEEYLTHG